jgi:hypothetical protein
MATKRLDSYNGNFGQKASVQRTRLTLDCREPRERLGNCFCGFCVVADDQLSCFLGELLARAKSAAVRASRSAARRLSNSPRKPEMLISRRVVSSVAPAMSGRQVCTRRAR